MEHINNSLSKYKNSKKSLDELNVIRNEIIKETGINPISIKKVKGVLTIRVNNQYQAIELKSFYSKKNTTVRIVI